MKSVADFKRAMTVGTEAEVTNHVYPELSGLRTVLRAQTNRLCLSLPESHPRFATTNGSWLDIPKASECTFNADGSLTISRDWGDTGPFVTIRPANSTKPKGSTR